MQQVRADAAEVKSVKIIGQREQIKGIAARWRLQYPTGQWGADKEDIYRRLAALDDDVATAKEVAEIVGNNSWCGTQGCDECDRQFDTIMQLGQEPDYDSHTLNICFGCLEKATAMARDVGANP